MKAAEKNPSPDPAQTRPARLKQFQDWELAISRELAQKNGKTFKYPLFRLNDNGRWMFVVCDDNTEIAFSKTMMNQYRAAEEWVNEGGKCPFTMPITAKPTAAQVATV